MVSLGDDDRLVFEPTETALPNDKGTSRHTSMEYYDPSLDKWTLLDSMSVGREGAGIVSLGDSLYCIGGYDGFNLLRFGSLDSEVTLIELTGQL